MFDVASDREQRRETRGYVAPAQARAFLEASRRLRFRPDTAPPVDPIARAHLRTVDPPAAPDAHDARERLPEGTRTRQPDDHAESLAAVVEVLRDAGIFAPQPRALLTAADTHTPRLQHIQAHMQFVLERDHVVSSQRNDEIAYLANTIAAGCSVQARPLSAEEAWDAATAVCNLGLENWPPHWLTAQERSAVAHTGTALPDDFLLPPRDRFASGAGPPTPVATAPQWSPASRLSRSRRAPATPSTPPPSRSARTAHGGAVAAS